MAGLLDSYTAGSGIRYYNVIHWQTVRCSRYPGLKQRPVSFRDPFEILIPQEQTAAATQ
jgi:hypothetical protein